MEIWKDIKGYEGLYQVSNMGRIKSLNYRNTGKEGLLSCKPNKNGYIMVGLSKNKKVKPFYVHRLVAENFLYNPNNYTEVNHIDENKENNTVYNLEWCNRQYNNTYGSRIEKASKTMKGKQRKQHKKPKLKRQILCIETNEIFDTSQDVINIMFNGKGLPNYIRANICGQRNSAYGYHFKYIYRIKF